MGVSTLRQAIQRNRLLFLDTMVFVYHLNRHPTYGPGVREVLEQVEAGNVRAITSALTVAEILTGPAQQGNNAAVANFELYLRHFPNLDIIDVGLEHARQIAQVRAQTGLRLPDSVQIAVAQAAGAQAIVTNDRKWRGRVGSLALILLDDYLAN